MFLLGGRMVNRSSLQLRDRLIHGCAFLREFVAAERPKGWVQPFQECSVEGPGWCGRTRSFFQGRGVVGFRRHEEGVAVAVPWIAKH